MTGCIPRPTAVGAIGPAPTPGIFAPILKRNDMDQNQFRVSFRKQWKAFMSISTMSFMDENVKRLF